MLDEDRQRDRIGLGGVHKIPRGGHLPPVQPHIQAFIAAEAEAAFGNIELVRRDAEIEQDAVHARDARSAQSDAELAEICMKEQRPSRERLQTIARCRQRILICIQTDDASRAAQPHAHRLRVSSATHRPVHIAPLRVRHQCIHRFPAPDRTVKRVGRHAVISGERFALLLRTTLPAL